MIWRPGFQDFFEEFRGRTCIVVFKASDQSEWWVAPLNEDGSEGEAFQDLTDAEESALGQKIGEWLADRQYDE